MENADNNIHGLSIPQVFPDLDDLGLDVVDYDYYDHYFDLNENEEVNDELSFESTTD